MLSVDAGGFGVFLLFVPHLYDFCGGWKFPHVTVWVVQVIWTPSCRWLCSNVLVWGLETFTEGNLPDSLNRFVLWKGNFRECLWVFSNLNTYHIVSFKYEWLTRSSPIFSPFFSWQERFAEIFGQDAAAESRRSQESFKKWLLAGMTLVTGVVVGSLIAQKRLWREIHDNLPNSLPRPASIIPLYLHNKEVKMKVLFVSSELLMMFTLIFFFPSHILWWTKNPHMFNFWEKEREESPVFICSPSSTLMKTLWLYRDRHVILSSTEPIVPFNPFSTGSCIIFLSSCLYVLVLTNFDFSFSLSREAETDSSLHS